MAKRKITNFTLNPQIDWYINDNVNSTLDHGTCHWIVNEALVEKMCKKKDELENVDVARFRRNVDPVGGVTRGLYLNRAAIKLANIDHVFQLIVCDNGRLFRFVDICAGPGGFTEYILSRHGWRAKG